MKTQNPRIGLTLGELHAWVHRQLDDHNRDPREPAKITAGWHQQITAIWMPENKEN